MKRLVPLLVIFSLLAPTFSLSLVAAESSGSTGSSSSANSSSTTTTKTDDKTTGENETESEPKTSLADRVSQFKSQFKMNLTKAQQTALKGKCKAAQGVLSSLSGRIKGIQTSRSEVYANITEHLASLQTKLQNNDVDTTELQGEIATLQTKINTYKTDLITYKQAVADLAALDCVSDPTAFKSTLEAARTAHDKVAKDVIDIRSYVNGTIKPTLVKIRQSLEANEQKTEQ